MTLCRQWTWRLVYGATSHLDTALEGGGGSPWPCPRVCCLLSSWSAEPGALPSGNDFKAVLVNTAISRTLIMARCLNWSHFTYLVNCFFVSSNYLQTVVINWPLFAVSCYTATLSTLGTMALPSVSLLCTALRHAISWANTNISNSQLTPSYR